LKNNDSDENTETYEEGDVDEIEEDTAPVEIWPSGTAAEEPAFLNHTAEDKFEESIYHSIYSQPTGGVGLSEESGRFIFSFEVSRADV
jgi:hypothetical protein